MGAYRQNVVNVQIGSKALCRLTLMTLVRRGLVTTDVAWAYCLHYYLRFFMNNYGSHVTMPHINCTRHKKIVSSLCSVQSPLARHLCVVSYVSKDRKRIGRYGALQTNGCVAIMYSDQDLLYACNGFSSTFSSC